MLCTVGRVSGEEQVGARRDAVCEGGVHRGVVGHDRDEQLRVVGAEGARGRRRLRQEVLELSSTWLGLGLGLGLGSGLGLGLGLGLGIGIAKCPSCRPP